MGCWSEYCLICGGPLEACPTKEDKDETIGMIPHYHDAYAWLNDVLLITDHGKLIPTKGKYYDDYGRFLVNDETYILPPFDRCETGINAIVCHVDCYNCLQTELGYSLKIKDVIGILSEYNCLLKDEALYGCFIECRGQDFDYEEMKPEEAKFLCSPLTEKANKERILSTWRPLVMSFHQ